MGRPNTPFRLRDPYGRALDRLRPATILLVAGKSGLSVAQILVVDDDPEIQQLLGYVLRREGHEIVEATTGEDALKLVQRLTPDLVILDLMLPGMDGFAVCERLRIARS